MSGDWKKRAEPAHGWKARAEPADTGAGGGSGSEGGAEGGSAGESKALVRPSQEFGNLKDFGKSFVNTAALGAGPQIEGGIAAILQDAENLADGEPLHPKVTPLDAYRGVRDLGKEEHAKSASTVLGNLAMLPGSFATPIPVKGLGPGASIGQKALQGAKVGAVVGGVSGAVNSGADLTKLDADAAKQEALDTFFGMLGGGVMGGATGGVMGAAEKPLRSTARKLPMDMLGVREPARRSMEKQGIYDAAGDDLLALVRPGRSGMTKSSLTQDALAELAKRGQSMDDVVSGLDKASGNSAVQPTVMADALRARAAPFAKGSLEDSAVAGRMNSEADNLIQALGDKPISLAQAEAFKQRFGPQAGKKLKMAGEPSAKTEALSQTYTALKKANEQAAEAAAQSMAPELAGKFVPAKQAYQRLAAPLEGAGVERAGMQPSDFDWGDALSAPAPGPNALTKALESIPLAGPAITGGLNMAGRTYGRGLAANLAEFGANRMSKNTGGGVGGIAGASGANALEKYLDLLPEEKRQKVAVEAFAAGTGGKR